MKTTDKTANLSQAQAKSMFKKYATSIVKILTSSGIRMVKKIEYQSGSDRFYWDSCITEKSRAKIHIRVNYEKVNGDHVVWVDFIARINYQKNHHNETNLEKAIRIKTENTIDKKYPLSNFRITVDVENPKIPYLNPEKIVARQLYLALKDYNKMYSPETISNVKAAEKKINKFLEEGFADVITESFFK